MVTTEAQINGLISDLLNLIPHMTLEQLQKIEQASWTEITDRAFLSTTNGNEGY